MDDLLTALEIFRKYTDSKRPTHCEHDSLYVCGIEKARVSAADMELLEQLGFHWDEGCDSFASFRFGSC